MRLKSTYKESYVGLVQAGMPVVSEIMLRRHHSRKHMETLGLYVSCGPGFLQDAAQFRKPFALAFGDRQVGCSCVQPDEGQHHQCPLLSGE